MDVAAAVDVGAPVVESMVDDVDALWLLVVEGRLLRINELQRRGAFSLTAVHGQYEICEPYFWTNIRKPRIRLIAKRYSMDSGCVPTLRI
jgi:hypothetical protein